MRQDNKRFSSLLLALLCVVGALVVFFDLVQPAYQDLQQTKGKEISQESFLANERQVVDQVKSLVSSLSTQAQGEQSVALALPVGQDVAGALAQVYGIASANNIGLQNIAINVQAVQQVAPPPAAAQAGGQIAVAASGGNIVKPVGSVSLQFTSTGTYENFKLFLKGLETNIRIFDVKSVSIHPVALPSGKGSQDLFQYDIQVTTYYQAA